MRGDATSTLGTNSQQVTQSQAESTCSATTTRTKHNEVGTSRSRNKTASGHPNRPKAPMRSWERELTKDTIRSSRNVFDRLSRNVDEDMRTHLEARSNSMTSRKREDLPVVSPINDEINELRARLKKLAARNTEVVPSTTTLPFT